MDAERRRRRTLVIAVTVLVPLLILAIFSFNSSRFAVWESFSLQWYRAVADDSNLIESSANSLIIAIVANAISASRASFASGRFVMPMTSNPWRRFNSDSARVEKAGPSMLT